MKNLKKKIKWPNNLGSTPVLEMSDVVFLKTVMEETFGSGGSMFRGWYPKLFYSNEVDCAKPDYIVADVHTDPKDPDSGDLGCIVHEGLGGVHLMLVAVDVKGGKLTCYAGPVMSHYEFLMAPDQRKSDAEWENEFYTNKKPQNEWTQSYLVPGNIQQPHWPDK